MPGMGLFLFICASSYLYMSENRPCLWRGGGEMSQPSIILWLSGCRSMHFQQVTRWF